MYIINLNSDDTFEVLNIESPSPTDIVINKEHIDYNLIKQIFVNKNGIFSKEVPLPALFCFVYNKLTKRIDKKYYNDKIMQMHIEKMNNQLIYPMIISDALDSEHTYYLADIPYSEHIIEMYIKCISGNEYKYVYHTKDQLVKLKSDVCSTKQKLMTGYKSKIKCMKKLVNEALYNFNNTL